MAEISATDASKRFADMLDAVEHRGESFTVVRRGRAVATIAPIKQRWRMGDLVDFLASTPPDPEWQAEYEDLRAFIGPAPTRDPWSD